MQHTKTRTSPIGKISTKSTRVIRSKGSVGLKRIRTSASSTYNYQTSKSVTAGVSKSPRSKLVGRSTSFHAHRSSPSVIMGDVFKGSMSTRQSAHYSVNPYKAAGAVAGGAAVGYGGYKGYQHIKARNTAEPRTHTTVGTKRKGRVGAK